MTNDAGLPGHFGMGWWTNSDGHFPDLPRDAVWGAGAKNQILLVVPSLNLIAVRNGNELRASGGQGSEMEPITPVYQRLFKPLVAAATQTTAVSTSAADASITPYPPSQVIRGVEFDFATHHRLAIGSDNWPMTWAGDGHQYTAWGDGGGFGGTNHDGRVLLGVARIEGDGNPYTGHNVWGGKNCEHPAQFGGKSYGILSVDGVLYMWVASQPVKDMTYCQIATSSDRGAHWKLADWKFTYSDELSVPTFLNFNRDYDGARDDYIYTYYIHPTWGPEPVTTGNYGFDVHRPGRLYVSRVPKDQILNRPAYEILRGTGPRARAAVDQGRRTQVTGVCRFQRCGMEPQCQLRTTIGAIPVVHRTHRDACRQAGNLRGSRALGALVDGGLRRCLGGGTHRSLDVLLEFSDEMAA